MRLSRGPFKPTCADKRLRIVVLCVPSLLPVTHDARAGWNANPSEQHPTPTLRCIHKYHLENTSLKRGFHMKRARHNFGPHESTSPSHGGTASLPPMPATPGAPHSAILPPRPQRLVLLLSKLWNPASPLSLCRNLGWQQQRPLESHPTRGASSPVAGVRMGSVPKINGHNFNARASQAYDSFHPRRLAWMRVHGAELTRTQLLPKTARISRAT